MGKGFNNRKDYIQFLWFGCIGVVNTVLDFLVYWLLVSIALNYVYAQVFAYMVGMLSSYMMNSVFTFKAEKPRTKRSELNRRIRFVIWNSSMLLFSLILLYGMTEQAGIHYIWSKVIVTVIIVIVNFLGNKLWVFHVKEQASTEK